LRWVFTNSHDGDNSESPARWLPTLTVWRRNAGNIAVFAAVLTVVFLVWARASLVIFAMFYTQEMPNLTGFLTQVRVHRQP
jgi:hypothetical protein